MHEIKDGGLKQFFILNIYLSISCIIDIQEIFVEQVNKRVDERIFKTDGRWVESIGRLGLTYIYHWYYV